LTWNIEITFFNWLTVPVGGCRLWCGLGVKCEWTKGLLLVENSMTLQRVTLLHTDWKHQAVKSSV
jgi:hypothetical protein